VTDPREPIRPEVLIIGAGPAGLTAAARLAGSFHRDVLVLDREDEAGGIPRHSTHLGFGARDMRRLLSGPAYARRLVDAAAAAGARIRTGAMVTGWDDDGHAVVTTPQGQLAVRARVTVLATGARERPRAARLVPGDRPAGVYTTGQLQNLLHRERCLPFRHPVIVGAELVSWSAALTLREHGVRPVLMTTPRDVAESYAAVRLGGQIGLRVPLATRTRVVRITGKPQVAAVELEDTRTGNRRMVACDAVIFTGDWIPDHELARLAGLALDPGTLGPLVDTAMRTSSPGVFAAGNLLHPVDTADVAALDGRHVAAQVEGWVTGRRPGGPQIHITAGPPLRWLTPGLWRPGDPAPARRRLLAWTDELIRRPVVTVRQGGEVVSHRALPWPAAPGRVFRIPWSVLKRVDTHGGDITIALQRR
jgi:NADPH-dependent 2,4-dienoyl-CoA reductase/sulfur reductase-like enzyme